MHMRPMLGTIHRSARYIFCGTLCARDDIALPAPRGRLIDASYSRSRQNRHHQVCSWRLAKPLGFSFVVMRCLQYLTQDEIFLMPSVEACEYHQPVLRLDYDGHLQITSMNGIPEIRRKWHLRKGL